MPLVRISLLQALTDRQTADIGDAVHDALVQTLRQWHCAVRLASPARATSVAPASRCVSTVRGR